MFKIIILVAIVLICSLIGYVYGESFKERYLELSELMRNLIDMENEIVYSYRPLPVVLEMVGRKSDGVVADIFLDTASLLENGEMDDIKTAFSISLDNQKEQIAMTKEDFDIILDLSKSLGDTDILGQEHIFALAKEKLSKRVNIAEKEYSDSCKMYKYLGVSVGLMIAIFLI